MRTLTSVLPLLDHCTVVQDGCPDATGSTPILCRWMCLREPIKHTFTRSCVKVLWMNIGKSCWRSCLQTELKDGWKALSEHLQNGPSHLQVSLVRHCCQRLQAEFVQRCAFQFVKVTKYVVAKTIGAHSTTPLSVHQTCHIMMISQCTSSYPNGGDKAPRKRLESGLTIWTQHIGS